MQLVSYVTVRAVYYLLTSAGQDKHLVDTLYLRSTPYTSLILATVASTDENLYSKIIAQFQAYRVEEVRSIIRTVAAEIQVASAKAESEYIPPPVAKKSAKNVAQTLFNRRGFGQIELSICASPNLSMEEHDFMLLSHRLKEDPDFPIAPIWHQDHDTQRSWVDMALQVKENRPNGFFVHEVLLNKLLREVNATGSLPRYGKLRTIQASAVKEATKIMKAETDMAVKEEPNRLLCNRIEHLMPVVATTDSQLKALRQIKLESLLAADVMELQDSEIITLLNTEVRNLAKNSDGVINIGKDCICDIISVYSEDVDVRYWNEASVLTVICNERKRRGIQNWIEAIEDTAHVEARLFTNGGKLDEPLEPTEETESAIFKEYSRKFEEKLSFDGPEIVFCRNEHNEIVLPLDDGYATERSEAKFTNMSGLSDVSTPSLSTASDSNSDQDAGKGSILFLGDRDTNGENLCDSNITAKSHLDGYAFNHGEISFTSGDLVL